MSVDRSISFSGSATSSQVAGAARSILACPADASLVVDGVDDVLGGMDDDLGMRDLGGQPTFSCLPDTPLAQAARTRRSALLTLESALGPVGSPERASTLTLSGRLESRGRADCECCGEVRDTVVMELNFVLLGPADDQAGQQRQVPLEHFRSPEHHLNRGFLQRSVEHANACHQEELRRAVSATTGTRLAEVVGVTLTDLLPHQVEVQWVDLHGSHSRVLAFPRPAHDAEELGELLRRAVHAGLC